MNKKQLNYIVLIFFILLGIVYGLKGLSFRNVRLFESTSPSPGYFPIILSVLLVILCLINIVATYFKKSNETINFPNLKLILLTIVAIVLFFISWSSFGYFFINVYVFILFLIIAYRFKDFCWKMILKNSIMVLGITFCLYLIFKVFLNIRL